MQGNMNGLITSLTSNATRALVESTLRTIAEGGGGDPEKQYGCALYASSDFVNGVLQTLTASTLDFATPMSKGTDADGVWDKLGHDQRETWLKTLELVLKADMGRKDLYEPPLNLYAALLSAHSEARAMSLRALVDLVKQASAAGSTSFATDANQKLNAVLGAGG
jgi:hypothetical protein